MASKKKCKEKPRKTALPAGARKGTRVLAVKGTHGWVANPVKKKRKTRVKSSKHRKKTTSRHRKKKR